MFIRKSLCFFIISLMIVSSTALAQSSEIQTPAIEASAEKAAEAQRELEKGALLLLDEVVSEAQTLKLAENRIRIQMTIAGLLWKRDEERARALFREATDGLAALTSSIDPGDQRTYNTMQAVTQFRHEMLNTLVQRDPKLALEFLRATRQPSFGDYTPGHKQPDQELALELNLAGQIAARDPQQAIRMAEESLSKGISSSLISVLQQVRVKDGAAAVKLTNDIIRRLKPQDFATDYEASNVAVSLLQITRLRETRPSATTPSTSPQIENLELQGILIDEGVRRELIEKLVTAATSATSSQTGNAHNIFSSLQGVMPEVERYVPTRVAALRRRVGEFERTQDPHSRLWREYQGVMQNGTIEAVLEAAAKAPPEIRDQLYQQAAWKASGQNETERARQIINQISNPHQRAQMLREFDRQLPWRAAERGDFEAARALLTHVTSIEERVSILLQLARFAANKSDDATARGLIDEARGLVVMGRAENQAQFSAQMQVAQAYAQTRDAARSFEVIEGAIDRLNELLAAAVVVDGFGQESFREGELKPFGGYLWSELVRQCAEQLAMLASIDFARARAAAGRFDRGEVRAIARMMVAQGVLSSAPQHATGRMMSRRAIVTRQGRVSDNSIIVVDH